MKIFKFPVAKIVDQDIINTTKNRGLERSPNSRSPQLAQMKKTGSLDLSYCFSKKKKELQKIYRVNSCQKKSRNKSSSSLKSTNENKNSMKPNYQRISNQSKELMHGEKKIFLNTEKKGKYLFSDLRSSMELILQKLQKCLNSKSDKIFIEEYTNAIKMSENYQCKENNDEILHDFLKKLCKCEDRKNQKKFQLCSQKLAALEKQKSVLNIELKKIRIKQQVSNQEVKKLLDRNSQLSKQLKRIKDKVVNSQFTQTDEFQDIEQGPFAKQFPKLLKQLKNLKEKENHMNILFSQLQRDGINLEKIYKKGMKYMQKLKNEGVAASSQDDQSSQSSRYAEYIEKSKGIKGQKHKPRIVNKHESDADDSIIDEMDAISFNYEQKQDEMQMYSPKRVYVCQKKMDETLKKKLQLNFECLYEQESSGSPSAKDFPTI